MLQDMILFSLAFVFKFLKFPDRNLKAKLILKKLTNLKKSYYQNLGLNVQLIICSQKSVFFSSVLFLVSKLFLCHVMSKDQGKNSFGTKLAEGVFCDLRSTWLRRTSEKNSFYILTWPSKALYLLTKCTLLEPV